MWVGNGIVELRKIADRGVFGWVLEAVVNGLLACPELGSSAKEIKADCWLRSSEVLLSISFRSCISLRNLAAYTALLSVTSRSASVVEVLLDTLLWRLAETSVAFLKISL